MKNAKWKIIWFAAGLFVTALFLAPILWSDAFSFISDFIKSHPASAPAVIILFRFLGVVLAPLPGAPVSLASIVLLPWWEAFAYNFIGATLGSVSAFCIARRFREKAVAYFAPLEEIHKWQEKVSRKKQFWYFVGLRLAATAAFDFVSYAAGLSKLPFRVFLVGSLIVDASVSLIFFYAGGLALKYSVYLVILVSLMFGLSFSLMKYFKR